MRSVVDSAWCAGISGGMVWDQWRDGASVINNNHPMSLLVAINFPMELSLCQEDRFRLASSW